VVPDHGILDREMQALLPERTNQFINVSSLFVYIIIVINAEMG